MEALSALTNGAISADAGAPSSTAVSTKAIVLGVCAMDVKARSRAMQEILTRFVERGGPLVEVKVFGDKVILDEDVQNWPRCDVLISFFSKDKLVEFPLLKAVSYANLRKPFCINDLSMQSILWDRRIVGRMLDHLGVPTPRRVEASRDGGPRIPDGFREQVEKRLGFELPQNVPPAKVQLREDGNAIIVDGVVIEKPFVEKPVSGEDHDVYVYFRDGKGGRKLFRKVGNQSSELDPDLIAPRTDKSYIYEEFIDVDNAEDIKVYTVGPNYTHAETRKSPVVDGVVRRNTEGKEIRFITRLSDQEKDWAARICQGFGQRVCGFDLLRCGNGARSLVIDVNGWSFVKGNDSYYDKAADILLDISKRLMASPLRAQSISEQAKTPEAPSWKLKANVTVFRHADRTPKQKLKYNFPITEAWAQPFVRLLNGEREEIILREREQLETIATAIEEARELGAIGEDLGKLSALNNALFKKIDLPGTKAQLKPGYHKNKGAGTRKLDKLTLVLKWGGEFTHAARYQSRDLGENMRRDISIMNKECLNNVKIYTSSERRVTASAEIFAAALLTPSAAQQQREQQHQNGTTSSLYPSVQSNQQQVTSPIAISPAASSSPSHHREHSIISSLSSFANAVVHNLPGNHKDTTISLDGPSASPSAATFSTSLSTAVDPLSNSPRISDRSSWSNATADRSTKDEKTATALQLIIRKDLLDDSNEAKDLMDEVKKRLKILLRPGEPDRRPQLTWPKNLRKEPVEVVAEVIELLSGFRETMRHNFETMDTDKIQQRWCCGDEPWLFRERWEKLFEDFCDVKQEKFDPSRVSELYDTLKYCALHHRTFLFAIFGEKPERKPATQKETTRALLESKGSFDLVAPQEYGIEPWEKYADEEIGVLTSLPLLRNIIKDLENARNSGEGSLNLYFTKESHIHTLLNLVLTSGLPIANPKIPELDYCSHLTFELYERGVGSSKSDKEFSIKLSLSEGAHSSNVLDSAIDARHALNVQGRKRLTSHLAYSLVIEKLSKHFSRVPDEYDTEPPDTPIYRSALGFLTPADVSSSDATEL
ncbi:Inositol hexakisphosphate and diphosphoinositol-pentakisphosphate kinase; AltName: Full=Cortical actin cytoskeleton protein asp1; AltName: Full=InsP6 and PP-IP5 kinase [Serendipita indica DSM 11827]|nr:Inositol hexakisphosphate and diphosphoinositol-pentakisphosphate kinase; AltName: Full=Cortical actin cytoskeleton protein asp1; AltName: Full=InsP6 and PP-IP5 kinase [Serendipita indica DSM 11827]